MGPSAHRLCRAGRWLHVANSGGLAQQVDRGSAVKDDHNEIHYFGVTYNLRPVRPTADHTWDNGPPFVSVELKGFCSLNTIQHVRTPPYSPQ